MTWARLKGDDALLIDTAERDGDLTANIISSVGRDFHARIFFR